jgi:hypothetical protein
MITNSLLSLPALGILALAGCSSTVSRTNTTTPQPSEINVSVTPSPNPIDPTNIPVDTKITLSRTICYGNCASSKLEVFADGRFVANGTTSTWHITEDRIKELISEFQRINYFSLTDDYSFLNRNTCPNFREYASSVTTSITINGQTKSVFHTHGCQDLEISSQLESFEDRIEELMENNTIFLHETRPKKSLDRSGGACFASNVVRRKLNEQAPLRQLRRSARKSLGQGSRPPFQLRPQELSCHRDAAGPRW